MFTPVTKLGQITYVNNKYFIFRPLKDRYWSIEGLSYNAVLNEAKSFGYTNDPDDIDDECNDDDYEDSDDFDELLEDEY